MRIRGLVSTGLALGLAALLLSSSVATAQEAEEGAKETGLGRNVLLTITLGEIDKGPQRTYRLVTRTGQRARMLVGWRTPIPTVRSGDETGKPVTSYIYQNVGMTLQLRPQLLADDLLRVHGEIEISGAAQSEVEPTVPGMPVIGTFQQELDVLLPVGEPLRIAEVPDPESGQRFMELKATLLD